MIESIEPTSAGLASLAVCPKTAADKKSTTRSDLMRSSYVMKRNLFHVFHADAREGKKYTSTFARDNTEFTALDAISAFIRNGHTAVIRTVTGSYRMEYFVAFLQLPEEHQDPDQDEC
jgi:hypothetical protein